MGRSMERSRDGCGWMERRIQQSSQAILMLGQRKDIGQIQRRAGNEDLFFLQLQMLAQISDELAVRLPIHLQADRRETAALFQDLLHLLAVILILIIHAGIQVDVRVAR